MTDFLLHIALPVSLSMSETAHLTAEAARRQTTPEALLNRLVALDDTLPEAAARIASRLCLRLPPPIPLADQPVERRRRTLAEMRAQARAEAADGKSTYTRALELAEIQRRRREAEP